MSEAEPDNLCDIVASVCPRAEVQQLLRQHFRHLHSSIRDGVFPAFRVPKRTVDNTLLTVNANTGLEYLAVADRGDCVVKSFNRLNQIDGITHMLIIMHVAEMLLREGKAMTQREIYYMYKAFFKDQSKCNNAIHDVAIMLSVSRFSLGILCSPRGSVAGCLKIKRSDGQWQDCTSCGISGVPITSSLYLDDAEFEIGDGVQYIIVVEKEGIFSRLTEDKLWERLPCVIVTGKGFPDAATRWFVSNLSRQTNITAIALCDWNPFGLSIYLTYRIGSVSMAYDAEDLTADIKWMGLRGDHVKELVDESALQDLSSVDVSKCKSLLGNEFVTSNNQLLEEVNTMLVMEKKCELEALLTSERPNLNSCEHGLSCFVEFVVNRCVLQDFVAA